ncbi:hypothetical protein OBBRIDRAFT_148185 [Obba rivulosa]|uniref:Uncharacterized protein n=1 Tax=Obba rivulosa TaxID=1052685 RepID=A0A8E2ATA4_9APHY|nr:hypothetical protein OBBRIDRAFT_148185 [Obba rivulosa]
MEDSSPHHTASSSPLRPMFRQCGACVEASGTMPDRSAMDFHYTQGIIALCTLSRIYMHRVHEISRLQQRQRRLLYVTSDMHCSCRACEGIFARHRGGQTARIEDTAFYEITGASGVTRWEDGWRAKRQSCCCWVIAENAEGAFYHVAVLHIIVVSARRRGEDKMVMGLPAGGRFAQGENATKLVCASSVG